MRTVFSTSEKKYLINLGIKPEQQDKNYEQEVTKLVIQLRRTSKYCIISMFDLVIIANKINGGYSMKFLNYIVPVLAATADPNATGAELQGAYSWIQMLVILVPLALMYVILIVPQRRKEKKQRQLIDSAIVGDQIITIGGLVGKIVNIKDDEVTFETSVERSKITIKKWAIKEVIKPIQA